MDALDPLDSIPFADEDEELVTAPTTTTTTTATAAYATTTMTALPPRDSDYVRDVGDSLKPYQMPEMLPTVTVVDAGVLEKKPTLPETSENHQEEVPADVQSVAVSQKSNEGDAEAHQETSPDRTNSTGDSKSEAYEAEMSDSPGEEVSNDISEDVNDAIRQTSDDLIDSRSLDVTQPASDDLGDRQTPDVIQHTSEDVTESQAPDLIQQTPDDVIDSPTSDVVQQAPDDVTDSTTSDVIQLSADDIMDSQTVDATQPASKEEEVDGKEVEGGDPEDGDLPEDQLKDPDQDKAAEAPPALTEAQLEHPKNDLFVSEEEQATVTEETNQPATENSSVELLGTMNPQGETHGGKTATGTAEDLVDDFFSTTSTSETVVNGIEDDASECILRIDEAVDSTGKDCGTSAPALYKEGSPEIIIGSVDSVENVTLKDATSEKALLGNGEDEGISSQRDSLSSRTDEDKRKSSSDMDMDFAVLETDSSHLNLDMSKQKTSLCKKGSLARRKKPSRGSVTHGASDSSDSMFQDSTDSKPLMSPTSDTVEDEVFDKLAKAVESQQAKPPTSGETYTVRKAAQPFKPSLIMPGLQDLSKSKLFNQERNKSDECPTSPVKSPLSGPSPQSPTRQTAPPQVPPKPTSKVQKDSQNKTIAAENASLSADAKSMDSSNVSSNIVAASVEEALVISKEMPSDSASSVEGPRPARSDSGSLTGPRFTRTDSWSSVSSPRTLSRRESTSSVEGGEGGGSSAQSTPRRASIQGSAYAPMGFRPRRSSSIVLDSNNKLADVSPALTTSAGSSALEKDSDTSDSSGVRSPTHTPPAWLSEIKAKTGGFISGDSSGRLRSTSIGSNDGSAVSASSGRSRNSSESADGVQGQGIPDEPTLKKQENQEQERQMEMKPANQRASDVKDKASEKRNVEENGDDEDKRPPPPWAADLKKKNRPFVSPRIRQTSGESNGKTITSPYKGSDKTENAPVINSGRDEYSPSWMKSSQQTKKPPPPVVPSKPVVANKPTVKPPTENLMRQYETPKWKRDLAEKKKRREAEMMPVVESSLESSDHSASSSTNGGGSSRAPQWQQQLSLRKKSNTDAVTEQEGENGETASDLAKKAEERRARLIKSGLFGQENAVEES